MSYTVEMSKKLNELLERTFDAEQGFKQAAENVKNPVIKEFFEKRAAQRYNFGQELKREIKSFGQDPKVGGSFKGTLHRNWMNVKNLIAMDEEEAMLKEVERGEEAAISMYNNILHDKGLVLPPSTEGVLMKQRNAIRETLETADLYENAIA